METVVLASLLITIGLVALALFLVLRKKKDGVSHQSLIDDLSEQADKSDASDTSEWNFQFPLRDEFLRVKEATKGKEPAKLADAKDAKEDKKDVKESAASSDAKDGKAVVDEKEGKEAAAEASPSGAADNKPLIKALMNRACADIELIMKIQKAAPEMQSSRKAGLLPDKIFFAFNAATMDINAEIEEVKNEANEIKAGWGEKIWPECAEIYHAQKRKELRKEMEKKAAQAKVKEEKKRVKGAAHQARLADIEKEKAAKAADKAFEELLREENKKASKSSKQRKATSQKKGSGGSAKGAVAAAAAAGKSAEADSDPADDAEASADSAADEINEQQLRHYLLGMKKKA